MAFKKEGFVMAKKTGNRIGIDLQCTECKDINYRTTKNKKKTTERIEIKKFCPKCGKETAHKEKK